MKRFMGDLSEMYVEMGKLGVIFIVAQDTVYDILRTIVESADGNLSSDYWHLLHLFMHNREALRQSFTHSDEVDYE